MVSVGVRLRTSDAFAVEEVFEYSTHRYQLQEWETPTINDPRNTVFDLTTIGRFSVISFDNLHFEILGGIGYSYLEKDEFVRGAPSIPIFTTPAEHQTHVALLLGPGIEFKLLQSVELSIETNWRMRFYSTPVTQIGIAYAI